MKREIVLDGVTYKAKTGCGSVYITINENDGKPIEVFATLGKSGGCACAQLQAIGRLLSWGLSSGANIEKAAYTINGILCHEVDIDSGKLACPSAVANIIQKYIESKKVVEVKKLKTVILGNE
ncbi:MAG: TSCPD domain-containing protein [Bacteroidetes bacterium]|nr:MAG: TSCPD domain-containing protein [Bacteroidota bacterium]